MKETVFFTQNHSGAGEILPPLFFKEAV